MLETIRCTSCGKETYAESPSCSHCGESLHAIAEAQREERRQKLHAEWQQHIEDAKISGDWSRVPANVVAEYAGNIVLTTTHTVPGRETNEVLEIITAECAYGMNIFRDFFANIRDIVGGRSAATQKVLRDARRTCLAELRREALMLGADAVVGVDLDYSEISGGGKSGLLFLVGSGTAVTLTE